MQCTCGAPLITLYKAARCTKHPTLVDILGERHWIETMSFKQAHLERDYIFSVKWFVIRELILCQVRSMNCAVQNSFCRSTTGHSGYASCGWYFVINEVVVLLLKRRRRRKWGKTWNRAVRVFGHVHCQFKHPGYEGNLWDMIWPSFHRLLWQQICHLNLWHNSGQTASIYMPMDLIKELSYWHYDNWLRK